jgi:hypothetical protein
MHAQWPDAEPNDATKPASIGHQSYEPSGDEDSSDASRAYQRNAEPESDYAEIQAAEGAILAAIAARHPEEQEQIAIRVQELFAYKEPVRLGWFSLFNGVVIAAVGSLLVDVVGRHGHPETIGAILGVSALLLWSTLGDFVDSVIDVIKVRRTARKARAEVA